MDDGVAKLKWIAATVAAAAIVIGMYWVVINSSAEDVADDETIQWEFITTYEACKALGGRAKLGSAAARDITTETGTLAATDVCVE